MRESKPHRLDVRDKPAFLHRLMLELTGDARVSLEGNLSGCQFDDCFVVSREETPILKRSTLSPRLDFVVLQLSSETVNVISKQVIAAGLTDNIVHVQIERHGVLELGAYDNFHPDCVVTGAGVPVKLLDELKDKTIIRDYQVATQSA